MTKPTAPPISFNGDNIPEALRANARWAPWKAVWSEKRQKFDKIPCNFIAPYYGLSTAKPESWGTFDHALKAYTDNPGMFAGLGYVMTGPHGVVGIDLDNCVENDTIADWATDVVRQLASYTEVSPSGKGLRIMALGAIPHDWVNHDRGIEVYAGHKPRFLTITGHRVIGEGLHQMGKPDVAVWADLAASYAKAKVTTDIVLTEMPELLDEAALPSLNSLILPAWALAFLTDGAAGEDRSKTLHNAAVALYNAGLGHAGVFSVLAHNEHAMDVAMEHRRQDYDKALIYLWAHHGMKAEAEAASRAGSADDFDVVAEDATVSTQNAHPQLLDWANMPDDPPAPQFVIPGWMPDGVVTLFAAHGGTGKSYLSLYVGLCLATGRHPFIVGREIPRVKVLLYSAEDPMQVMLHRLASYMRITGIAPADLEGWLQVFDATECDNVLFTGDDRVGARTTTRFRWLAQQVKAFGADVLIFDNASDAMDANENDRAKVRQFMSALKQMAPAVLLLAHVDAVSSMADPSEAKGYSGSTGWHNSARSRWFMSRVKDSDDIVLTLPKVNYAKAGAEVVIRWSDSNKVFEVISTRDGKARAADHRGLLLGLLRQAEDRGLSVSPTSGTVTSMYNTFKDLRVFPRGVDTRIVSAEVNRWLAEGLARTEEFKKADRKMSTRLVLTDSGRKLCEQYAAEELV